MGRDSSVGIATRYGLDSPGFEPGGEEIFCIRPDHLWVPPSLLHNGYRLFLSGVKQSVRDVYYPPPHSAEVKERVELHRHSPPLCFHWHVYRLTCTATWGVGDVFGEKRSSDEDGVLDYTTCGLRHLPRWTEKSHRRLCDIRCLNREQYRGPAESGAGALMQRRSQRGCYLGGLKCSAFSRHASQMH